jgi:hypothetical protein
MLDTRLQRPRFRFIHDTVVAVMRKTGFPDGLFSGAELDATLVPGRSLLSIITCLTLPCLCYQTLVLYSFRIPRYIKIV